MLIGDGILVTYDCISATKLHIILLYTIEVAQISAVMRDDDVFCPCGTVWSSNIFAHAGD